MQLGREDSCLFATTPTTVLFGMLTLRVGMKMVSVITLFEGVVALYVFLDDEISGDPYFRWGLPSFETPLRWVSGIMGAGAILFGVLGLRSARTLHAPSIQSFRRFQACLLIWIVTWFVLVGMPVDFSYVSVPVVDSGPLAQMLWTPRKLIIDPEWPHGRPVVCQDAADIRVRLAVAVEKKFTKTEVLGKVVRKLSKKLLRSIMPCQKVIRIFWACMLGAFTLRMYCMWVASFFHKVVLQGGDGVSMFGSLEDLHRPYAETMNASMMLRERIRNAFDQIDEDHDGRLSLEEVEHYLERTSLLYRNLNNNNLNQPMAEAAPPPPSPLPPPTTTTMAPTTTIAITTV